MGGTLEEEAEYTDSETSPTSPLVAVGDEGGPPQYREPGQRYQDTSFQFRLRYDQDSSLQYHRDTSFQYQVTNPRHQDAADSHQRSASYDMSYNTQQTGDQTDEEELKARSAADMGQTDEMVERYWEVATPPHSVTPTASPPPPVVMTPTYGNFLSPDDAKRTLRRPASPLAQKSYTSDSPDKLVSNQR